MPSSPQESSQPETPPGLTRMNQMIATESNRPVYPLPGLDNMTATTEHSNATTIVAARLPKPDPIVTKTVSSATTTHLLSDLYDGAAPLENSSTRSLDLDTVSERPEESGLANPKRTKISEFLVDFPSDWVSRGAAECFRRCDARRCRFCQ